MRRGRARHKTLDHDKLQLPFKHGSVQPKFLVYKEMEIVKRMTFTSYTYAVYKHTLVTVM